MFKGKFCRLTLPDQFLAILKNTDNQVFEYALILYFRQAFCFAARGYRSTYLSFPEISKSKPLLVL